MFEEPGPMPEEDPESVALCEAMLADPAFEAELFDQWETRLDAMSPKDRFEHEYGLPAEPEYGFCPAPTTEETAFQTQARAVQAERMARVAEAHRIDALVAAHDASTEDLEVRFGPTMAARGGLGEQTFNQSIALRTQQHPNGVAHEVNVALEARERLPRTWAVFLAGNATFKRLARAVTEREGLDRDNDAAYDEAAARIVATSTRVKHDLIRERERLQDDTAASRAKAAKARRHTVLEIGHDGQASYTLTGPAVELVAFDQTVHRVAVAAHGVDGETRTVGQLEYDIAVDLLLGRVQLPAGPDASVPARKVVVPEVMLTVPALAWLGITKEQAELAGYGPIDLETAKALAGTATSFVRVLSDPVTGARITMDRRARRAPVDLARWVKIRDGRSRFPGGTRSAWLNDIDHAREWQHDGPTADWNLISLSTPEHNRKSAGLFTEEMQPDTSVRWKDVWGNEFVDPPPDPQDPAPTHLLRDLEDDGPPF